MSWPVLLSGAVLAALCLPMLAHAQTGDPSWPSPVAGFVPPTAGEHPRLFFRKAELPKLRQRAATPEGKILVERTKFLLDGAKEVRPAGKFTLWDGAGYGFLWQITQDKAYLKLATDSINKAWETGVTDKDARYSLNPPGEPLRTGPAISAIAMAYDLCYDGWTPEERKAQAQKIYDFGGRARKKGGNVSLEQMALNPMNPNPVSNHFGLTVGGVGLTILALQGDPELTAEQNKKLETLQQGVDRGMKKLFTYDFGEGGYFGEHPGPGVISVTWTVLPYIKASKVAAGRDWISNPKYPAAEWVSLRFVMQLLPVPAENAVMYPNLGQGRGGYGGDILEQAGGHHATYFSQGFGAIEDKYKPGMLWVYNNFVEPLEAKQYAEQLPGGQKSFDAFNYPHRLMMAFINWPWELKAENPDKVLPKVREDKRFGQYIFRNRWQDKDDIIVSALYGARTSERERRMMVWGFGQRMTFANLTPSITGSGKVGQAVIEGFEAFDDGSGSVSGGKQIIGVDFSKASGADGVVVMVGANATGTVTGLKDASKVKVQSVEAGGTKFSIMTLSSTGQHPTATVSGNAVTLGGQTITSDGKLIKFAKVGKPIVN